MEALIEIFILIGRYSVLMSDIRYLIFIFGRVDGGSAAGYQLGWQG